MKIYAIMYGSQTPIHLYKCINSRFVQVRIINSEITAIIINALKN